MIGDHTVEVNVPVVAQPAATNRALDPSGESGIAGSWASNNGSLYVASWDSVTYKAGSRALKTVRTATSPSNTLSSAYLTTNLTANALRLNVAPGEVVSFGVWAMADANYNPTNVRIALTWRDAAGAAIGAVVNSAAQAFTGANVWQWFVMENTVAPAGTAYVQTTVSALRATGVTVGNEQVWFDALMVNTGPKVEPYFDGSMPGCSWAGIPYQSQSIRAQSAPTQWVDLSCWVDQVAIRHGRSDTTGQPEAASATLDLDLADPPPRLDVGTGVRITTELAPGEVYTRFAGTITDLALGWDDAGEDTPNAGVAQVTAVATLADLGRRVVGDAPFPQELDGARVSRVLALAGVTLDPAYSDPGTAQILPRDIDATDALSVATEAADSASGILWQTRAGEVRYADADHRRHLPSVVTLDACQVLVTPTWSRSLQGLVNKVSLGYGAVPEGGEQPRVTDANAASIAHYGTYDYSLTTTLANLADAQAMAGLLVARNAKPVWVMTALPVAMADLDHTTTGLVLGLDMHNLLTLTGMPVVVPGTPATAALWVEGWSETLAFGVHELELVVSGYCRTSPPTEWDDMDPSWTWDTIASTFTWDDAACFGPLTAFGRWADVPASLRWDATPPATTWDTWPTDNPPAREVFSEAADTTGGHRHGDNR